MTYFTRFPSRSATSGTIVLNSARKQGNTQKYWYYLQGEKASCGRHRWIEFDVRDLAAKVGKPVPDLCGGADFDAIQAGTTTFEQVLQRDLQRVADFCASVDAPLLLTPITSSK